MAVSTKRIPPFFFEPIAQTDKGKPGAVDLGEHDLLRLVETLKSIEKTISSSVFLVDPSASKTSRNEYLRRVLRIWLAEGGTLGGPNSAMVNFFRAACIPVLGKVHPTNEALVKMMYAIKQNGPTLQKSKRLLKIKE